MSVCKCWLLVDPATAANEKKQQRIRYFESNPVLFRLRETDVQQLE